jgi:hypothetical protein
MLSPRRQIFHFPLRPTDSIHRQFYSSYVSEKFTFKYIYIYIYIYIYRVILKSPRDFRHLRYSSRDGHAEGEHVNRGRDTPNFCSTLQVLDMCTLGDAAVVNPLIKFLPRHQGCTYRASPRSDRKLECLSLC